MALPTRLVNTWPRRYGSPIKFAGILVSIWYIYSSGLSLMRVLIKVVKLFKTSSKLNSIVSMLSWPASILEKSRISSMMPSSDCAESPILSTYPSCFVSSDVRESKCPRPIMAFIGVRIS